MEQDKHAGLKQRPIRDGLFHQPSLPHEKPYLIGSKCSACGYVAFPRRPACPICVTEGTMKEIPLGSRGRINTFTVSHVAPKGFTAPYVQAYVDLPEGPRVFSLIVSDESQSGRLRIGAEVELLIERICNDENGCELIGYKFRLV